MQPMGTRCAEGRIVRDRKIARDQHIPALNANPDFELCRVRQSQCHIEGVPSFPISPSMLAAVPDLDCVSICTPPQAHFDAALRALRAASM
jgi:predicted dehydrogenase